jgi:L-ascorbate metabolism protein UlaG (beta-lactamase superfamily)
MKITLVGHCTVLIETDGKKIVTDPYFGSWGNLAYRRLSPPSKTREDLRSVDLVLLSHNHWDHIDRQYLRLLADTVPVIAPKQTRWVTKLHGARNVVGVDVWESQRFGDTTVTAVPASHTTVAVGFVIHSEEKQIYFAGDTYYHPFMESVGRQFHLDVALLPVTGYRIPMTMDEIGAVRAVEVLSPKVVIPIHQAIRPRLSLLCTNHTPEGFRRRVRDARLASSVVILQEGQSWEV